MFLKSYQNSLISNTLFINIPNYKFYNIFATKKVGQMMDKSFCNLRDIEMYFIHSLVLFRHVMSFCIFIWAYVNIYKSIDFNSISIDQSVSQSVNQSILLSIVECYQ